MDAAELKTKVDVIKNVKRDLGLQVRDVVKDEVSEIIEINQRSSNIAVKRGEELDDGNEKKQRQTSGYQYCI